VLTYVDSPCDENSGVRGIQMLNEEKDIQFILSGCVYESPAVAQTAQDLGVVFISSSVRDTEGDEAVDYVFHLFPTVDNEVKTFIEFAQTSEITHIALVTENTNSVQTLLSSLKGNFEGSVVLEEEFIEGKTSIKSLVQKIHTANPQVVYLLMDNQESAEDILRQMNGVKKEAGIFLKSSLLNPTALLASPELYEGVFSSSLQLPEEGKTIEVFSQYQDVYGESPKDPLLTASTYDSLTFLLDGINSVGGNPEKIVEFFQAFTDEYSGVLGTYSLNEQGDIQIKHQPVEVIGGEIVIL